MKLILATLLLLVFFKSAVSQNCAPFVQDCAVYDQNGKCTDCIYGFVLKRQKCIAVSYLCDDFDPKTGACLTCIDGFKLCHGICKLIEEGVIQPEPNVTCVPRTVPICGQCVAVSDQCKTWSMKTALCESCYGGYRNVGGVCVIDKGIVEPKTCPYRTVKIYGVCEPVSDLCETWYQNGDCKTCYLGYGLKNGACVISNRATSSADCVFRQVYKKGRCINVSDQCLTWS